MNMTQDQKTTKEVQPEYVCRTEFKYRTSRGRYFLVITTYLADEVVIHTFKMNVIGVKSPISKVIVKRGDPRYSEYVVRKASLMDEIMSLEKGR